MASLHRQMIFLRALQGLLLESDLFCLSARLTLQGLLLVSDLFCFSALLTFFNGRPQQRHLLIAQSTFSTVLQGLLLESDLICFSARLTSINGRPQQRHLFTVKGSFSGPCKVCCLNLISFDSLHV